MVRLHRTALHLPAVTSNSEHLNVKLFLFCLIPFAASFDGLSRPPIYPYSFASRYALTVHVQDVVAAAEFN